MPAKYRIISLCVVQWGSEIRPFEIWDLNNELVSYLNGLEQFIPWMVHYSSHVLSSKLIVHYLNGKKFGNRTKLLPWSLIEWSGQFNYLPSEYWISKIRYSDKFAFRMFPIQIPVVLRHSASGVECRSKCQTFEYQIHLVWFSNSLTIWMQSCAVFKIEKWSHDWFAIQKLDLDLELNSQSEVCTLFRLIGNF